MFGPGLEIRNTNREAMIHNFFASVDYSLFFLSAILFIAGIYTAPTIVEKNITILLKYPRWMRGVIEKVVKKKLSFLILFFIIFFFNNLSLFGSFASGFLIILPPAAAFFTGLNVAIISFDMMGWKGIWQMLINPVAWLEFPAAWISFALGFQLALTQLQHFNFSDTAELFFRLIPIYLKYVFSLLLIAGILETGLIIMMEKFKDQLPKE